MNTLPSDFSASRVWFDDDNLWVALRDGRQISTPLAYFPRLLKATPAQREKFDVSGGGVGIHWDELDEDINVAGLFLGLGDVTLLKKSA